MNQQIVLTTMPLTELRGMIIDCVSACLKAHTTADKPADLPEPEIKFDLPGLAKYLDCSLPTIHNLKKEGILPFYRLGRKVYFKKSEVDGIARVAAIGERKTKRVAL